LRSSSKIFVQEIKTFIELTYQASLVGCFCITLL